MGTKIFGQLEKAQYENIVGNAATALAVGRFWVDITTPSAGIPKMYDGTNSRSLLMAPTTGSTPGTGATTGYNAIGNSGSALTVNWATAPSQSIALNANCLITFSNPPAAGQICTLIVAQATAAPFFQIRFQSDTYWQRLQCVPDFIPPGASRIFKFISTPAYLSAVTTMGNYAQNPVPTLYTGTPSDMKFSPDGQWVVVGLLSLQNYLVLHKVSRNADGQITLGTGYTFSAGFVSGSGACAWHPSSNWLAVSSGNSALFIMSVTGGVINQTSLSPSTPGYFISLAWSPAGDALIGTSATSPFIQGWPWVNGVLGTAYSAPATIPPSTCFSLKFNPSGAFFAVAYAAAPGLSIYAFNSTTGFGAKSANPVPATLIATQNSNTLSWSHNGSFLAMGCTATPFVSVWPVNTAGVFGTVVANPASLPTVACQAVCFSAQDEYLATVQQTGNGLFMYNFTASGAGSFGTLLTAPTGPPPTTGLVGVEISPDNEAIIWWGATSPYAGVWQMPRVVKNSFMSVGL